MRAQRRRFISGAIATAFTAAAATSFSQRARRRSGRRIVIGCWGGALQRAMRACFFAPFTRDTGIEVIEQTYGSHGLARLKTQLRAGAAQVDLLDGEQIWCAIGRKQELLDKIDVPSSLTRDFFPGAINDYGFGYATCSWGIACADWCENPPGSWRDFWSTRNFKGRRTLFRPYVERHIEYALMADGIVPGEVYPLTTAKIERAFGKLAEIRPAIAVWYETAAQCEQLFLDEQVEMGEFFSGRTFYLRDQGARIHFVWNQAILNVMTFVLARNAPNHDCAIEFLKYISRPEPQAALAKAIFYGPANTRALALIQDRRILERLPSYPPNLEKQIVLDAEWWGENVEPLRARWQRMIST